MGRLYTSKKLAELRLEHVSFRRFPPGMGNGVQEDIGRQGCNVPLFHDSTNQKRSIVLEILDRDEQDAQRYPSYQAPDNVCGAPWLGHTTPLQGKYVAYKRCKQYNGPRQVHLLQDLLGGCRSRLYE